MKQLGVLILAIAFISCAAPKSAVKMPASNPYANRPNLLVDQAELVKVKKFGKSMMIKCKGALAISPDASEEPDAAKRSTYRVTAFRFCAARFDDFTRVAEMAVPRVHGKYLEAVILWKHVALTLANLTRGIAACEETPAAKKPLCRAEIARNQVTVNGLVGAAERLYQRLIGDDDDAASKRDKDKKK